MYVSKEKVFDVLDEQKQYITAESDWVWKLFYSNPTNVWTVKDTQLIIEHFSRLNDFTSSIEDDNLEVTTEDKDITMIVNSIQRIQKYCNNEFFDTVPHEWFKYKKLNKTNINEEYILNIGSVVETKKFTKVDESSIDWSDVPKYYKQYKNVVFTHSSGFFRIVIEYSRSSDDTYYNSMKEANLPNKTQNINIYMETSNDNIKDNTNILISQMMFSLQQILNEYKVLTLTQQSEVIDKYTELISEVRDLSKYEKLNPKPYFLAPKPITLEKKNMIEPNTTYGIVSILQNYAVTDKADGERMLLYVDNKGEVYLINNTLNVKQPNMIVKSSKLYNSLYDGEYIPKHLLNDNSTDTFAIFDVYFLNNKNVMDLPLMDDDGKPSRYHNMEKTLIPSLWNNNSDFKVEIKKHYRANGKELLAKCKEILDNRTRRYDIDGLVFTPIDLPVFSYYPNKFKKIKGKSVAWNMVFKWKPSDQNTIDFLVNLDNGEYYDNKTNIRYKKFKLYTGYNASRWEGLSVDKGIEDVFRRDKSRAKSEEEYIKKLFKPIEHYTPDVSTAYVPINRAGKAVTEDGSIIEDNMIVEFSYNRDKTVNHSSMRWVANRIREDKTRALKITGSLSKTANDLSVAMSIWHNIFEPVTYEHIIGEDKVDISEIPSDIEERLLGTNDVYYAREIPRNHMLSVHMLNFHNYGIKSYLYEYPDKKNSLLELACGMAGDLPRWRDSKYDFILGVDLVKDNIEGPQGAYSRYINQRKEVMKYHRNTQKVHYPQAIFLIGDCALPLDTGEAARGKDYDSEQLLKLLYMGKVNNKYNYLNKYRITGKASKKFDVVSCQFAIHYFFKNKDLLEGFLRNVSLNLNNNGKFICTFMDGQKVHKLINKDGYAKGEKEGSVVWCIQKQYKTFSKAKVYGNMIDVYLENTNKFIPEYLVHFDFFKEKAFEYGLEIVESGFFEDTFKILKQKVDKKDKDRNKFLDNDINALSDDPVQTQFSFINRWAIFRKV